MDNEPCKLIAFRAEHGRLVAGWVLSRDELFFVAPTTSPPLTPEKVRGWTLGAERGYLFLDASERPVAYGELNPMPHAAQGLWIGHFLVDPRRRGQGLGRRFLHALLCEGFDRRGSAIVGLVVFPGNEAAIRCYRGAGLSDVGPQYRRFPGSLRRQELRYMRITREEFRRLRKRWWPHAAMTRTEPAYA